MHLRDINTGTWRQQGHVEEELSPRSYRIQTECGLSLRRNCTDLQLQPIDEDTTAQEVELQQNTPERPELPNSEPDHTTNSLTAVSKSPTAERHLRP